MLGRRGEPIRKWVGLQAFSYLSISPGISAEFVEDRDTDHPDVARVAIPFLGVGFPHRAETKRRDRLGALTETFNQQRAMRINHIAALADRGRATIDHVETIS